jgi:hypothetical protein
MNNQGVNNIGVKTNYEGINISGISSNGGVDLNDLYYKSVLDEDFKGQSVSSSSQVKIKTNNTDTFIIEPSKITMFGSSILGSMIFRQTAGPSDNGKYLVWDSSSQEIKLNTIERTGWQYVEDLKTQTIPLNITNVQGWVNVPNDGKGSGSRTDQLPSGISFYNSTTNLITPQLDGDSYTFSLRVKIQNSSQTGSASFRLNINNSIFIELGVISLTTNNLVVVDKTTAIFSGSTFVANGGILQCISNEGTSVLSNIQFLIVRNHKSK